MTLTAKFSNGFTDTYKGRRDVKAAWMITRKSDGKVLGSGHSLDVFKAEKTARGNARYVAEDVLSEDDEHRYILGWTGRHNTYFENKKIREFNAARMAKVFARIKIEIISI